MDAGAMERENRAAGVLSVGTVHEAALDGDRQDVLRRRDGRSRGERGGGEGGEKLGAFHEGVLSNGTTRITHPIRGVAQQCEQAHRDGSMRVMVQRA
jgi:hypothetical protein